jgi:cytochrome c
MKYITGKSMRYRIILFLLLSLLVIFTSFSCGDKNENESERDEQESINPLNNKGIGPIKSVSLTDFDNIRADVGKSFFEMKCSACHKLDE